jgi:hypothetical protein
MILLGIVPGSGGSEVRKFQCRSCGYGFTQTVVQEEMNTLGPGASMPA